MYNDTRSGKAGLPKLQRRASSRARQRPDRPFRERFVSLSPTRPATRLPTFREVQPDRFSALRQTLRADLYRKTQRTDWRSFVRALLTDMGFKHVFWFRLAGFAHAQIGLTRLLYPPLRWVYRHYEYKHGVWIPPNSRIGPGLFLEHLGDIVVNSRAVIGKNCNLASGVTIGQTNRGNRKGTPTIGNNVFIGPGAKILGGIRVGHNVAIGANCVVIDDVPDNAVVVAQPGQIISYAGSAGYVNHTDYAE